MFPSGTVLPRASFRSLIDWSCSGPQTEGVFGLSKLFNGSANSLTKTLQMPIVPRNIRTSDTFLQADHLSMTPTQSTSGNLPSLVHLCPTTVISLAHSVDLYPEKVPPQYFICCMIQFTFWKCSHTNLHIPSFSFIFS